MEPKQEIEVDDIQSKLFGPIIFLILVSIWFMLYFKLINFNSCAYQRSIGCVIVPLMAWVTWLVSSLMFLFLCIIKLIKDRQLIDLLILIGYSALYFFTVDFFFS